MISHFLFSTYCSERKKTVYLWRYLSYVPTGALWEIFDPKMCDITCVKCYQIIFTYKIFFYWNINYDFIEFFGTGRWEAPFLIGGHGRDCVVSVIASLRLSSRLATWIKLSSQVIATIATWIIVHLHRRLSHFYCLAIASSPSQIITAIATSLHRKMNESAMAIVHRNCEHYFTRFCY